MGGVRREVSDARVANGHTLASIKLCTIGKFSVLGAMLTVTGVMIGMPRAPLALAGFAVIAAGFLFISAFKRNLARWRRRAALGLEPQSIGTATLTAVMALDLMLPGVEDYAIRRAEATADEAEVDRLAQLRREHRQRDAKATENGTQATAGSRGMRLADYRDADFPTTTLQ